MTRLAAQKRLASLWFGCAALLAALLVVLTLFNRFAGQNATAWQWYSQNIVPSLTLITGSFYATAQAEASSTAPVDVFAYRLCFGVSAFYLLALLLTVLAAPLAREMANLSLLDLLATSETYLILLQGIASYALGIFFAKSHAAG